MGKLKVNQDKITNIDEVIKRFIKFKSQHNKIYVYEKEKREKGGTKDER